MTITPPRSVSLFGHDVSDRRILSMLPGTTGYSTHRPMLALVLAWFDSAGIGTPRLGTLYEFGCGDGSTPFLSMFCQEVATHVFFDSDVAWFEKFVGPGAVERAQGAGSIFCCIRKGNGDDAILRFPDWDAVPLDSMGPRSIDLALIDHAPGERRKAELTRLREKATFVVVHDSEQDGCGDYGLEPVLATYRYRLDDYPGGPGTTLASNYVDVSGPMWAEGLRALRSIADTFK